MSVLSLPLIGKHYELTLNNNTYATLDIFQALFLMPSRRGARPWSPGGDGRLPAEKGSQARAPSPGAVEPGLGHAREEPRGKGQDTKEGSFTEWCVSSLWRDPKGQKKQMRERKESQSFPEEKRAAWGSEGTSSPPPPSPPNFTLHTGLSWAKGQFSLQK